MSLLTEQYSVQLQEERPVILLSISNSEDCRLVREYLPGDFEIIEPEGSIRDHFFDLCITDDSSIQKHGEVLQEYKEQVAPVFLPILLLSKDRQTIRTNPATLSFVDDVVYVPVSSDLLQSRIELMLQTRWYSLQLENKTQQLEQKNRQLQIFEQAINSTNAGVVITDSTKENNPIVFCNRGFKELTGYSEEEILGRNCRFLQNDDRQQDARKKIRSHINQGKQVNTLLRNYRKNGDLFWNELNISPITDEKGNVTHFIGIQNDVTKLIETQKKLEEEKERYRLITENATDMIGRHAPDGTYLYVTPSCEQLLGFTPEELIGENPYDTIHPDDIERIKEKHEQLLSTSKYVKQTYRKKTKSGNYIWVESISQTVRDPGTGEIVEIQSNTRNINERKEYEQKLKKEQEFTETAIDNMPSIFFMVDENMNFVFWNKNLEEELGYSAQEIEGMHPLEFFQEEDQSLIQSKIEQIFISGNASIEAKITSKSGELIDYFLIGSRLEREEGTFIIGSAINITDRVKAERKLRESEQRWEQLVEKNPGLIQITDSDKIVRYVNPAGAKLYGFEDTSEVTGNHFASLIIPEERERLNSRIHTVLEKGKAVSPVTYHIKTPAGAERVIEMQGVPITYKNETVILTIGKDVTENYKYEEKLEQSLEEKNILLQEIHHRVKNNLAIISGLLELQSLEVENTKAREMLENSKMRIHSIAKVHELLYQHEELNRIDFNTYIVELTETMDQLAQNDELDLTINYQLDQVFLNIDQAIPCGMVINELITNSIKHAFPARAKGTITISLYEEDNQVNLSIADDGIGLPDSFDLEEQGTLGKTIINLLIQQLHANFRYTSDNGTSFELSFNKRGYTGPAKKA